MSTPHPDVETLADLDEGLLEPAHASLVDAHAAACTDCAQLLAAVRGVPSLLAGLSVPPLPAHVAARIDAVLAAESEQRLDTPDADAAPPPTGATVSPVPLTGTRKADRHPRWRNLALAAASAAVVVGGASVVVPRLGGTATTTGDSSAAQAGSASEAGGANGAAAGAADRPGRSRAGADVEANSGEVPWPRRSREEVRRRDRADGITTSDARRRAAPLSAGATTGLNAGMPAS